jgi:hypothetical protein
MPWIQNRENAMPWKNTFQSLLEQGKFCGMPEKVQTVAIPPE